MPLDFIGITVNRLWELFEANPDWTARLRPGNRIKLLGQSNPYPQKSSRMNADFGEAIITLGGPGEGSITAGQLTPRTFGNTSGRTDAPFIYMGRETYLLAISFDGQTYEAPDAVYAATVKTLAAAGAKLGMPTWVKSWAFRHVRDRKKNPVTDEFYITVEYAIQSQDLLLA